MPRQLRNINIGAPAFKGINTEDSPLSEDVTYADTADNCIIDKNGRLAARSGYTSVTDTITELGGEAVKVIHELELNNGTKQVIACGNNKILKDVSGTLTNITGAATVTNDYWKIVTFNNYAYFFNGVDSPLKYDGTTVSVNTGAPAGAEALAAFGRLWAVENNYTIKWSDLLDGTNWTTGTSGSIDVSKVWPDGYDEITAISAHNNFLIIFGRNSIIVYSGADDPATMALSDTINGVGCVARDSVQNIGSDVLFLSHGGVMALGRVLQEQAMPVGRISSTITNDLLYTLNYETDNITSVYNAKHNFYLLLFPLNNLVYCFDTRGKLESGALRVTRWVSINFNCFYTLDSGELYIGNSGGIGRYFGYTDNGSTYRLRWYTHPISFNDPSRLKMLKKIRPTFIGGPSAIAIVKWAYDFSGGYKSAVINLNQGTPAEYNIDEYNTTAEYTAGITYINKSVNTGGHGSFVSIGIETEINGYPFSIQQVNIEALIGKMI